MTRPRTIKIPQTNRCEYCGHEPQESSSVGGEVVIYSRARAEWLEKAANQLYAGGGFMSDDGEVDWRDEHKKLLKAGE